MVKKIVASDPFQLLPHSISDWSKKVRKDDKREKLQHFGNKLLKNDLLILKYGLPISFTTLNTWKYH